MFKVRLRFGNILFVVESEDKWKALVNEYKGRTMDEVLSDLYTKHYSEVNA